MYDHGVKAIPVVTLVAVFTGMIVSLQTGIEMKEMGSESLMGRIVAASCYLPLTLNPRLDPELGTRHRAAIGLTEETDAVAIVVSEQTGAISLVEGGRMTGALEAGSLRARLGEIMVPIRRRWRPIGLGAPAR
jgi:hypothetical protein